MYPGDVLFDDPTGGRKAQIESWLDQHVVATARTAGIDYRPRAGFACKSSVLAFSNSILLTRTFDSKLEAKELLAVMQTRLTSKLPNPGIEVAHHLVRVSNPLNKPGPAFNVSHQRPPSCRANHSNTDSAKLTNVSCTNLLDHFQLIQINVQLIQS